MPAVTFDYKHVDRFAKPAQFSYGFLRHFWREDEIALRQDEQEFRLESIYLTI